MLREGHSFLRSALFGGECLTSDGRAPWAAERLRTQLPQGSVLTVPGGSAPFLLLVLVRKAFEQLRRASQRSGRPMKVIADAVAATLS